MLREVSGGAIEQVPLGGDLLSRGSAIQDMQSQQALGAFDSREARLKRELKIVRVEGKRLDTRVSRLEARARVAASGNRESLSASLRADGYGIRAKRDGINVGPFKLGRNGFRMSLPAMLGGRVMPALGLLYAMGGLENTLHAGIDEYNRLKKEGGTDAEATRRAVGAAAESVANSVTSTLASMPGVRTAHRLFGRGDASLNQAKHMWERAAAFIFNRSELQKREHAAGNAELAAHTDLDRKFDKLVTSGPRTFRLKNAHAAEIYKRDRVNASQALREQQHSDKRWADRKARIAGGN